MLCSVSQHAAEFIIRPIQEYFQQIRNYEIHSITYLGSYQKMDEIINYTVVRTAK